MPTIEEVNAWEGQDAYGPDAEKIGEIADIYLDQDTGRAEWVTVKTGMFGSLSFAPLAEAHAEGDHIQLTHDKDTIKNAPQVDADDELSGEEVAGLYRFYGVDYYELSSSDSSPQQGVIDRDTGGRETDPAMTRSPQDLDDETVGREGGRGRLRRHFASEPQPITDAHREQPMASSDLTARPEADRR